MTEVTTIVKLTTVKSPKVKDIFVEKLKSFENLRARQFYEFIFLYDIFKERKIKTSCYVVTMTSL